MRAALIRRNGPPEILEVGEVTVPWIARSQVLVRVHATSVNPVDCYVRAGGLRRFAGVPFPIVPGVDISGVVENCGENVRSFSPGNEVFAFLPSGLGASAEFAACEESWLARKPESLSHTAAGVLPCVGLTALQGLRDKIRLTLGQRVLIVGASGGVGTMAVQIAHAMGAEVTAVCSSSNINFVRSLGAAQVIDYTRSDLLEGPTQYDGVFECVGSHHCWYYRNLLNKGGRHVGISCSWRSRIEGLGFRIVTGKRSFQFHVKARPEDLELLGALVEQGKLKPIVSHVYTLAQIVEAHRQCETHRTVGKIAVQIS